MHLIDNKNNSLTGLQDIEHILKVLVAIYFYSYLDLLVGGGLGLAGALGVTPSTKKLRHV